MNGYETWAVEAYPEVARRAQSRIDKVLIGDFECVRHELPERYSDLVVCNDAIEHMTDHDRFLSQIKTYISPGGCLVGSIPNIRYYKNLFELFLEKDWRYEDFGILDKTYLRFYTEKSFRYSLHNSRFQCVKMGGINHYVNRDAGRESYYKLTAKLINVTTFSYFDDVRYLQFAFQAKIGI